MGYKDLEQLHFDGGCGKYNFKTYYSAVRNSIYKHQFLYHVTIGFAADVSNGLGKGIICENNFSLSQKLYRLIDEKGFLMAFACRLIDEKGFLMAFACRKKHTITIRQRKPSEIECSTQAHGKVNLEWESRKVEFLI
ncbi:hypothetical protein QE152_g4159 [Popillia japonica]|uniref:Uncharacterized protein n=1 Tax=Popillia japonica TaxID=7064 RepID=A0AAW1N1X5_POPJA